MTGEACRFFAMKTVRKQVDDAQLSGKEDATRVSPGQSRCSFSRYSHTRIILVVDIEEAEVEMPEWQDWLIGIPVLIALLVILLVEVTDR